MATAVLRGSCYCLVNIVCINWPPLIFAHSSFPLGFMASLFFQGKYPLVYFNYFFFVAPPGVIKEVYIYFLPYLLTLMSACISFLFRKNCNPNIHKTNGLGKRQPYNNPLHNIEGKICLHNFRCMLMYCLSADVLYKDCMNTWWFCEAGESYRKGNKIM